MGTATTNIHAVFEVSFYFVLKYNIIAPTKKTRQKTTEKRAYFNGFIA